MVAVLGPRAINESKFTSWSTHCKVLGLLWDTTRRTVSIPVNKIQKARDCVRDVLADSSATKTRLRQVLGTLRRVCSCIPPARAFYQRLHCFECNIRGHARVRLPRGARLDLLWFDYILAHGRLSGIPTSMFVGQAAPRVHLYMDASAQGLCVLHPSTKHYIRVKFDEEERRLIAASEHENGFSINVREQLSAAFAVLLWGSSWSKLNDAHPIIVRCWLDNSSAVSWCNRLSSPNKYAQELNRVIGTCEAGFNIALQASHLPGALNRMADAGSRAWTAGTNNVCMWTNLSSSWQETSIPNALRKIYEPTSSIFNTTPSPTAHSEYMPARGNNGASIEPRDDYLNGYRLTDNFNPFTLWSTQFTAGATAFPIARSGPPPCEPSLAISLGIIVSTKVSHLNSRLATTSFLRGCNGRALPPRGQQPVTINMLRSLSAHLDLRSPKARVILGAACLGYFFLLRRSEFLAERTTRHRYALEVGDVEVTGSNMRSTLSIKKAVTVTVHFRASKNDQAGQGATRTLHESGDSVVCPVLAAIMLLRNAAVQRFSSTTPICSFSQNNMATAALMTSVLRVATKSVGQDSSRISCHSLRVGGATAMFGCGIDTTGIQLHGRWRSSAYLRYTRMTDAATTTFAERMASTHLTPTCFHVGEALAPSSP